MTDYAAKPVTDHNQLMVERVGEGLWQGARYSVAAVAAAIAFALPPVVALLAGLVLVVLRLIAGLLFGMYHSVLEVAAGLVAIPLILTVLTLAAIVVTLIQAVVVSALALTPAAVVIRLITRRFRTAGWGLAAIGLLAAGLTAGLITAVVAHVLVNWLTPGPGLSAGVILTGYAFALGVGGLAAAVYGLTLLVMSAARRGAEGAARWAREVEPLPQVRPELASPGPLASAGTG
jgi:hypothetical protein